MVQARLRHNSGIKYALMLLVNVNHGQYQVTRGGDYEATLAIEQVVDDWRTRPKTGAS